MMPGVELCAYVCLAPGHDSSARSAEEMPAAIRQHCSSLLPPAAVPAAIKFLEALPVAASGKLDRGALPPPQLAATNKSTEEPGASAALIIYGFFVRSS